MRKGIYVCAQTLSEQIQDDEHSIAAWLEVKNDLEFYELPWYINYCARTGMPIRIASRGFDAFGSIIHIL